MITYRMKYFDRNGLKKLRATSQPPLTHLTKTLTMKKFYVFQEQM